MLHSEHVSGRCLYEYPYESDIGLYAMVSVSELKKQSQIGRAEDAIGTDRGNLEGIALGELTALRGTRMWQAPVQGIRRTEKNGLIRPKPRQPCAEPHTTRFWSTSGSMRYTACQR